MTRRKRSEPDLTVEGLENRLKDYLGGPYGGPSLSYNKDLKGGMWQIYVWMDAPVSKEVLGEGLSIFAAMQDVDAKMKAESASNEKQRARKAAMKTISTLMENNGITLKELSGLSLKDLLERP